MNAQLAPKDKPLPRPKPRLCNAIVDTKTGEQCQEQATWEVIYGIAVFVTLHRCAAHKQALQQTMIRSAQPLGPQPKQTETGYDMGKLFGPQPDPD